MASEKSLRSDLEWQAFQYAAGELYGAERDSFEARLANDLAACEALAAAVMLCQAVVECEQPVAAGPRKMKQPARRQVASWPVLALLSSAACLALMVSWIEVGRPGPRGPLASEGAAGLATLWIDGAEANLDATDAIENLPNTPVELVVSRDPDELPVDESEGRKAIERDHQASVLKTAELDAEDDDAVPGWMLAAVAERQQVVGDLETEIIQD